MVLIYSEMLQKKFGGQLGARGDEYIGYIVDGAARMEQLLKDLRTFAQSSALDQEKPDEVDANEVLRRSLGNLKSAIEANEATVTHGNLPSIRIHEFQLELLFQNLIGNAIRYRSAAPPEVHVAAERCADFWTFSVQDNGIGIDPQYKEHIFGIFKRLHSAAQYAGTGMGLAICERITRRLRWPDLGGV